MKILVWLVALSLIPAVLFCKWVVFPISNQLRGLHFSPLGYSAPPALLWSYGAVAAVLIVAWAIAFQREWGRLLCLIGTGLLMLALTALMQVAFYDPVLLKRLANEASQVQMALFFTNQYLPSNPWIEPARARFMSFDSLAQRVWSGWYFLGFGWYATIAAGVAALSFGLHSLDGARRARMRLVAGAASIALAAIFSSSHIRAQLALDRAAMAVSMGELSKAVGSYHQALRLDGWNRVNPYVFARIGEIDSIAGRTETFEYRIYHAELLASQNDFPSAIGEYHGLAASGSDPSAWMHTRESELWASYGLSLLNAGAFGEAVAAFEKALSIDPNNWLAAFYLSRGYFLSGRYQQTIDLSTRLLERVSDPQYRAGLYCNLGDAHTRLGDLGAAHLDYRHAWTIDEKLARRVLTALVGP